MLPKGILFDLDDTIIAFDTVANPTWQRMCETYARQAACDPTSLFDAIQAARTWFWSDEARHKRGRRNLDQTRREIVGRAFAQLGLEHPALAQAMADAYSAERETLIQFFPRAEETLHYRIDHQVSLALLTNGDGQKQRQKVIRFGLARFFKTILIEGEQGYGKPEAAVYQRALADLGLTPDVVWSVGDHLEWDVAAPQQLGILGIWHDVRAAGLPPASPVIPDRIVTSIAELMV